KLINQVLDSDPAFEVIANVGNGTEAIEKAIQLKPDIIIMDLHIKNVSGIEATHAIMELAPTPIVIMQSLRLKTQTINLFEAMEAGALDLINKEEAFNNKQREFLKTLKLMS